MPGREASIDERATRGPLGVLVPASRREGRAHGVVGHHLLVSNARGSASYAEGQSFESSRSPCKRAVRLVAQRRWRGITVHSLSKVRLRIRRTSERTVRKTA